MFFTIKGRTLVSILVIFCLAGCGMLATMYKTEFVVATPKPKYIVVVDAGHGGIDGGSTGTTYNTKESDLNLTYAKTLEKYLTQSGIGVVMTRTTKDGLYDTNQTNLKKSDMKKRKEIIDNSNANCVISIHMNSFKLASCNGAQVFFKHNSLTGKDLADCIQNQFLSTLPNAKNSSSSGDYYMVNCTELPSVIVECGFISNPQEEKLLLTKNYREKLCYLITCGIVDFLGSQK